MKKAEHFLARFVIKHLTENNDLLEGTNTPKTERQEEREGKTVEGGGNF